MIFRATQEGYNKATGFHSSFSTAAEVPVLQVRNLGGRVQVYQSLDVKKCRNCRNLPAHSRWTGDRVCTCGNPFVNDIDSWRRRQKRQQAGLPISARPDDEKRQRKAQARKEAARRADAAGFRFGFA